MGVALGTVGQSAEGLEVAVPESRDRRRYQFLRLDQESPQSRRQRGGVGDDRAEAFPGVLIAGQDAADRGLLGAGGGVPGGDDLLGLQRRRVVQFQGRPLFSARTPETPTTKLRSPGSVTDSPSWIGQNRNRVSRSA